MPMDGVTLGAICNELNSLLCGGKVDKVQQPEVDTIILTVRNNAKNMKLLLTLGNHPRVHITKQTYQSPQIAPSFCMLLRKHLTGGRIQNITRPGNERIVFIDILSTNELGDITSKRLVIEIMGKYSNIILLNSGGMVIDAIRRINESMSRVRQIMPHDMYELPPNQDKIEPTVENINRYFENTDIDVTPRNLSNNFVGISKAAAEEMLTNGVISARSYINKIKEQEYIPYLVVLNDVPFDFLPFKYDTYTTQVQYPSFSEMLDEFYGAKDRINRTHSKAKALHDVIANHMARATKKQAIYLQKKLECENMDQLRIYGELLTSNLYRISRGSKSASVENYYDPDCKLIDIPLDNTISPQANAQRYFKQYAKLKTASHMLDDQITNNTAELKYLESLSLNIDNCTDLMQLEEIRQELVQQGYIKQSKKTINIQPTKPLQFISPSGIEILVGRNNIQNDQLTLKIASKDDIWLHIKDAAGAHVIIRSGSPDQQTLEIAATLAAYYSKSKQSSKVAVDATKARFVKKPRGAKPGMVIYENQTTYYVSPSEINVNKYTKQQ